jgi:hypothetical protein
MKTAIIYSGQARTFAHLRDNHRWFIHRHHPDAEFFVSVADDAQADDMLSLERQGVLHFEKVVQPDIPEPKVSEHHFGYPIIVPVQAVLKQLWSLERAYDFFLSQANVGEFYQVIRIRPDSRFMRYKPRFASDHMVRSPWWARWGGINDRFAVMGTHAASSYFRLFSNRQRLLDAGCPCHPETMLGAWLDMSGMISLTDLACEFGTLRLDGTLRPIDPTVIDIAEYAHR